MVSTIDIALIIFYFVIVIWVALRSSRRMSVDGYLIAERKLGVFDTIATITASKIATGVITAYVALVYVFGIGAIWVFVGYTLGYLVFYFFAKRVRALSEKHQFFTLADYFHHNYGALSGYLAGAISFAFYFFAILIQFIGGSKILSIITGLSYEISLIIVATVIFIYLFIGGFSAMVKTDTIQYVAMAVLLVVLVVALSGSFTFVAQDWNLFSVSAKDMVSFFLGGLLLPLSTVDLYQRVYAAKNKKTMKKGIIWASLFFLILGSLITFLALITKLYVPTGIDPDVVLVQGFVLLLPVGLTGLGIVTLFAIIMSSADTYLFTSASIFAHDIYGRLGAKTRSRLVRFIKWSITLFTALGILFALLIPSLIDITYLALSVVMVLSVAILATWILPRINRTTVGVGMIAGLLGIAFHAIFLDLSPSIALSALAATVVGLIISGIFRKIKIISQRTFRSR